MAETALEKAKETVEGLMNFRDTYVTCYGLQSIHNKKLEVEKRLKEVITALDHLQLSIEDKATFFYLRGKALNVVQDYDPQALDCLSKAVKLDPGMVEAWNELGECYWKNKDIDAAKNCFTGAIAKKKNKVSLRSLSMVQRQMGKNFEERLENIRTSVDTAKEAVSLDITDGQSWFVLGNAYMSMFFFAGQNPASLKQCMAAYMRAEKDERSTHNPDLYFNRAVALRYQEDFDLAIADYKKSSQLDPEWDSPSEEMDDLIKRLQVTQDFIQNKGSMKPKKLKHLLSHIKDADLGPFINGSYTSPLQKSVVLKKVMLADLHPGMNPEVVVNGKIVALVPVKEPVPFVSIMIDANQTCMAVSIFNMGAGKGPIIGDSIAIPEPYVQKVDISVSEQQFSFLSIRVDNPVVMVINKHKVSKERLAFSVLSVSNIT